MSVVHNPVKMSLVQLICLVPVKGRSKSEMEGVTTFKIADGFLVTSLTWFARGVFLYDVVNVPQNGDIVESVVRRSGNSTLRITITEGEDDTKTFTKVKDWYRDKFLSSAMLSDGRIAICIPAGFDTKVISRGLDRLKSAGKIDWELEVPHDSEA